jgi:hypothetical protein
MKRTTIAAVMAWAFTAAAAAQAPPPAQPSQAPPPEQPSQAQQPRAAVPSQAMTLSGCLYREEQVAGRTPNPAERVGILEDYILADASIAASTKGPQGLTGNMPPSGNQYKVEGIADETLKRHVGKRVEVVGKIDPEGGTLPGKPRADRGIGPDKISLPDIEATSIREVAGTCPATPAPRK